MKIVSLHNNKVIKVVKSKSLSYLLSVRNDYKKQYSNTEIEFYIVASEVKVVRKPRGLSFEDIPDFVNVYGVNSDGDYYGADKDFNKVVRLKPKIFF